MGIEEELSAVAPKKDMALTIGVFDGVHLGHKFLIARVKEQATQQDLMSGVVTFSQHPQEIISPGANLPILTDLNRRRKLLEEEGVDKVIILTFNQAVARLSARQFVGLLKKHLRLRSLVIGPDFALGQKREGNIDALREMGRQMGFTVTVAPPVRGNGDVVSSTAIRQALAAGDMAKVQRLMGRYFSLHGKVVTGEGRGANLGFPTANLDVNPNQALPSDGIYATLAYINDKVYKSATSIGTRPTFNGSNRTVEVYIMNFADNLYGRDLRIDIIQRIRDEQRFSSIEALKRQLAEDVKKASALLDEIK